MTSAPDSAAERDEESARHGSTAGIADAAGTGFATVKRRRFGIGPAVFAITLVATLLFFWWLLIYDHGVSSSH